MKKSEVIHFIETKIKKVSPDKLNEIWNALFEEEKIDEINKKNKNYFIDLMADEISYVEDQNLIKAYKILKESDL